MADFRRVVVEQVVLHRAVRSGLEAASGGPAMSRSEQSRTTPSGFERCCEARKEPEKRPPTWQISGEFLLGTSCCASELP